MDTNIDRKIRALLALAEDSTTTEAEAALAAARAAQLVKKYNIDIARLHKIGTPSPFEVVHADISLPFSSNEPAHLLFLRGAIAELFDVFLYKHSYVYSVEGITGVNYNKKVYRAIGLKNDIEAATKTLAYLVVAVENLLKKAKSEKIVIGGSASNSYRKGAGSAIFINAKALKAEMINSMEGCKALVLSVQPMIDEEVEKMNFRKAKNVNMSYKNQTAFNAGYVDGSLIDLSANKKLKAGAE